MEFFEVLEKRRSIRHFRKMEVEAEKFLKIMEAANSAPSAHNFQAYEIYVVTDQARRDELSKACRDQKSVAEAPVVLVFCANPERSKGYGERGTTLYPLQDATIATTFAMLSATALGLSSVWIGSFDEKEVMKAIGVPQNLRPVAVLPIGYPDETPLKTARRSLKDIVHKI